MKDFFCGKRILITGGAQRVGAFMAEFFAVHGATVLIHANKSVQEAEKLAKKLNGECYFCDLADIENLENFGELHMRAYASQILCHHSHP